MILIAFDCDGTIDASDGPIPVSKLYDLNIPPYIQIVVVSASPFCARLPFPRFVSENTRLENLLAGMSIFRAVQIFSERMKEDIDPEMKESYRDHIEDFQKLKEKVKNTPEC